MPNFVVDMKKQLFNKHSALLFKRFSRTGYALFACLGKEVLIGVLSVSTLTYAKADSISVRPFNEQDSVKHKEVKIEEVVITGSRVPLTALQAAKIVTVISRDDIHRAAIQSLNDVLKLAIDVDVRQRGGFGVQTDISINGGTFDQITLLLNGVNISNPQTGHNASDFPVSLQDIERIEVLEGAASRVFGTSAFNGAINIVTKQDKGRSARLTLEGGSYGTLGAEVGVTLSGKVLRNNLSAGYTRSDGGTDNSAFKKGRLFYDGRWRTGHLDLAWQFGGSIQDYGANTFYSAKFPNQWENTQRLVSSVTANIINLPHKMVISPTLYWNRFVDHYQLIHGKEGVQAGENYHALDVYGATLNAHIDWLLGKTAIGADIRQERILSTAYGSLLPQSEWKAIRGSNRSYDKEAKRTNVGFFVEHDVILGGFTMSVGMLANRNTGLPGGCRFYPGIDLSYRPNDCWKLYASWNKALRMPTYTDLYTGNSAQQGDPSLKPEKNSTLKLGARYRYKGIEALVSGFYSKGENMIDWVYETPESAKYHALNIGKLDNMGISADLVLRLPELIAGSPITRVSVGYAYIYQRHEADKQIFKSLYALEYLRHKLVVRLEHNIYSRLKAAWSLRWQQRMNGYTPYTKLDCKLMWDADRYIIFLKADNLTNHRYFDLGGVPQPGLWIMAGASVNFNL